MIDLGAVGENFLTILILFFFGWMIYLGMQKKNSLAGFREKFGKVFNRSKLK